MSISTDEAAQRQIKRSANKDLLLEIQSLMQYRGWAFDNETLEAIREDLRESEMPRMLKHTIKLKLVKVAPENEIDLTKADLEEIERKPVEAPANSSKRIEEIKADIMERVKPLDKEELDQFRVKMQDYPSDKPSMRLLSTVEHMFEDIGRTIKESWDYHEDRFFSFFNEFVLICYQNSKDHGFWDGVNPESVEQIGLKLMLIVSEASEAMEEIRKGNLRRKCNKPIDVSAFEEEMADVCIRVFDLCGALGLNLGRAIYLKHHYNKSRPFQHGKVC